MISIIPVTDIPIIQNEKQLWQSLKDNLQNLIEENDVLVCAHTPFSRVMGYHYLRLQHAQFQRTSSPENTPRSKN